MIIDKVIEMIRRSARPLDQRLDRMRDFKIVAVVMSGIQRFIQLIVGHGMQHGSINPFAVIPMDDLAHQPEVRLQCVGQPPKLTHEAKIEHVGSVQPNPVNVERFDPEPDHVQQVRPDLRILMIQLGKGIETAPVIIGKPVSISVIPVEIDASVPVPVRRILPVRQEIAEGEEFAAGMIEDAVEDDADPLRMAFRNKRFQVFVRPQPRIQLPIIGRLVSMSDRFKKRPDIQRAATQRAQVRNPWDQRNQPVSRSRTAVPSRRAGQPQWVNMIKNRFVVPCRHSCHLSILLKKIECSNSRHFF